MKRAQQYVNLKSGRNGERLRGGQPESTTNLPRRRPPTQAELRRLFSVLAADPDLTTRKARRARDELVELNAGLVWRVVHAFWLDRGSAVSREDLFQVGNVGLLRAIEKFDLSRGNRFSTYATWWIKQAMGRYLDDTATTVRVPVNVRQDAEKMRKAAASLRGPGIEPKAEEVRHEAVLSEGRAAAVGAARSVALARPPASLDEPRAFGGPEGQDRPLVESLEDGEAAAEEALAALEEAEDAGRLREAFRVLPDDLALVVRLRFGLDGEEEHSLREIGERIGTCQEVARRRVLSALDLLRQALDGRYAPLEGPDAAASSPPRVA